MTTIYALEETAYDLCDGYYPQEYTRVLGLFTKDWNAMLFMRNEIRQDTWRRNEAGNYAYGNVPDRDNDADSRRYDNFKPTYEIVPMELDKDVYEK